MPLPHRILFQFFKRGIGEGLLSKSWKSACIVVHCGEGCRGEGGVALGGSGGAGEEGVEDVVDEGLLLESGW